MARLAPVADVLRAAADAVDAIRAQSGYHWVDVAQLFGVLAAPPSGSAAPATPGAGAATPGANNQATPIAVE